MSQAGRKRRTRIAGQFAARLIEMLESPAYRVLSLSAHRIMARLEIELAAHGGTENGRLPVTYDQFSTYGIHRHAIAPGIRELEALGFIEVTERGRGGNAEFRTPNLFRLTYKHTAKAGPTDEWKRAGSIAEAQERVRFARNPRCTQKEISSDGKRQVSVSETITETAQVPVPENITTGSVRKPALLSISRDEAA